MIALIAVFFNLIEASNNLQTPMKEEYPTKETANPDMKAFSKAQEQSKRREEKRNNSKKDAQRNLESDKKERNVKSISVYFNFPSIWSIIKRTR